MLQAAVLPPLPVSQSSTAARHPGCWSRCSRPDRVAGGLLVGGGLLVEGESPAVLQDMRRSLPADDMSRRRRAQGAMF
jgi:hypothetical protein